MLPDLSGHSAAGPASWAFRWTGELQSHLQRTNAYCTSSSSQTQKAGKALQMTLPFVKSSFSLSLFLLPSITFISPISTDICKKRKKKENYSGWSLNRVKRTLSSTHPTHAAARGRQRPRTYTGRAARSERRPHQSPARPPGCV